MTHENVIDEIGVRINILVIALIILAVVLAGYMFVECALLIYSVYKKKQVYADPDSVVVKDDSKKSKKSKKSTKSKKSKKSKGSSRKLSKAEKKALKKKDTASSTTSARSSKASETTLPSQSQAKKVLKPKPKKSGVEKATLPRPDTPKPFDGFKSDDYTSGTSTEKLNAKIPPQFGKTLKAGDDSDFTSGTATEQINARIPPQFEKSAGGASNQYLNGIHPTPQLIREVAGKVIAYLAVHKSPIVNLPQPQSQWNENDFITPKMPRKSISGQFQLDQRSLEQQLASPPTPTGKKTEENGLLTNVGLNGEINKIVESSPKPNATNSLMLDTQNVIPIDGRPNEGQQTGNAKDSGTKP